VIAKLNGDFMESDILCKNEFYCFAPLHACLLVYTFYGKCVVCNQLLCLRFLYTCLPDYPVALYQCLMSCVNSNRVLDP
jgi:hypothetical protein